MAEILPFKSPVDVLQTEDDIFVLRQQIADLPEPGKATTLLMIAAALVNMPDDPAKAQEFYATIRREIERVWPQVKQ